ALAPLAALLPAGFDPRLARGRTVAAAAGVWGNAGLGDLAVELGLGAAPGVPASRRERRTEVAYCRSPPPEERSAGGDHVGLVIARSGEGDAIALAVSEQPGIEVIEQPSFWEVRAPRRLVIRYDELSERLGYEIDAYGIQRELSTHYGRLVAGDDALMLFADPTEALAPLLA